MPTESNVRLFSLIFLIVVAQVDHAQATQLQSISPDSPRWELEGQAKATEYQPLTKGHNELILAVSEIGGGWGFVCRLMDFAS